METEIITLKNSFEKMLENKKVNLEVTPLIEKIKKELEEKKDEAINKKLSREKIFHIYHSTNICNNIFDVMIKRLKNALENHDNPRIAKDTLAIYPPLFTLITNLEKVNLEDMKMETFPLLILAADLEISAIKSNLFIESSPLKNDILEETKEAVCNLEVGV